MKFILYIFTIFYVFAGCSEKKEMKLSNEKQSGIVSDEFIYSFVNDALAQNDIYKYCENIIDIKTFIATNGDSTLISKIDTIFSQEDKTFIGEQYLRGNKFVWKNKLRNKKIIKVDTTINNEDSSKEYWKNLLQEKKCLGYLDLPLFNKAKNMAVVTISYNCGMLCAEGGTYIYKLDNKNQWKLYLTLEHWIS